MSSNEKIVDNNESFTQPVTPNIPPINVKNFADLILKSSLEFTLSLHNKNNFNKKDVELIQKLVVDKITGPISIYLNSESAYSLDTLREISNILSDPFKLCSSDYQLKNWLLENNYSEEILEFSINEEIGVVNRQGEAIYDEKRTTGALVPLRFQFKKQFEDKNLLNYYLNEYDSKNCSNNNEISNFMDGKLWQKKIAPYPNEICVPYFMYIDDFGINNPLGSHPQSISGIYFGFPWAANNSKLDNVFLAGFIKSLDFKNFGNDKCLQFLINEINEIEINGLEIKLNQSLIKVHFILGLLLGDNLGLNSVLDFSKSFSSNYFCRFCKADKLTTQKLSEENPQCLRTIENYEFDLLNNCFEETGIAKSSLLNDIKSFHVVENFAVDMMHDIYEGICHYDICHIIKYYINEVKLFSLETINYRKEYFNYGHIEVGNISRPIKTNDLKKFRLKMSASEMKCFVHFLPLMIADLIPEGDEVWDFFLCLLQIIDILLSNKFTFDSVSLLKQLIKDHNTKYCYLFKDSLKPKHHFLTHYPSIILYSGPPKHYWSFRFEAKHKEFKSYAQSTNSRKNITLTLAKKYQLKFAHYIFSSEADYLQVREKNKTIDKKEIDLTKLWFKPHIRPTEYIKIIFKGTCYKIGYFLTKFTKQLCLFKIVNILVFEGDKHVVLVVDEILIEEFNSHYCSYKVDLKETVIKTNLFYNITDFSGPPINVHKIFNGQLMIRLREYF